jgi:ornithine--oxo-acid transaminase
LKDENMSERALVLGERLRQGLNEIQLPILGEVRGKGLLNAIVIQHPDKEAAWNICLRLMENGLLAKPTHGDKIRFAPPLVITEEQVDECVEIIHRVLKAF